MSLIAVTSPGDAPGATTTSFALTLTWPQRVLLAECSPSGGRLLRGYFQCHQPPDRGLWNLALAAVHGPDAARRALWEQLLSLDDDGDRLLLAGLTDPFLAVQVSTGTWDVLADLFTALRLTVIADAGPVGPELAFPLLRGADLVVVVMRPTLAQVAAVRPRLTRLRQSLGRGVPVGLCVIGDRPYEPSELIAWLGEFAIVLELPHDPRTAGVLSDGAGDPKIHRRIGSTRLIQDARRASTALSRFVSEQQRTLSPARSPTMARGASR